MEIKTEYKGIGTKKTLDYEEIVKIDEKEKKKVGFKLKDCVYPE